MNTKNKNIIKMAGILLFGLLLGWLIFGGNKSNENMDAQAIEQNKNTIWTCSMHPQIRQSEPGNCPICGMELIPLESDQGETDPRSIQMTENAIKLANIQTMIVGEKEPNKELRLNGKVQVDERKLYAQSTHIPGRIEQLNINFTGEKVSRGQTLAMVYSPELVTAQEELLQANGIKESQPELFNAAKEKLRNWKIGENTINKIITTGKPIQRFPISADVSGIVTAKKVELGDYVDRGMSLYEITDLSAVWVMFDIYESDMPWVKVGQKVTYTIQSFPGKTFEGKISFIDPFINPLTRVASARVEVKNTGNTLKPEMFVSGIVKNDQNKTVSKEIVIPKTAVMWTGERSVVYIKANDGNMVNFKLREVTLGPSLGDAYIIKNGLSNGEEIVVNGTFTVDSASQLAGKPSMMNPAGGTISEGHDHGGNQVQNSTYSSEGTISKSISISNKAKESLHPLYNEYFAMKDALTNDDLKTAKKYGSNMLKTLENIDMNLFKGESHNFWMNQSRNIKKALEHIDHFKNIEELRSAFQPVSKSMIVLSNTYKPLGKDIFVQYCPMADNNKGANWLSLSKEIENPYFGKAMHSCGEVTTVIK
ncbi:MAG: efflux RND transporter periplasmic adaptor subunit [Flavobacteriaceae bacterium]|nr:efflux RND transporter periplasmic adaptor subunit [Flavobacteriaceae bacterium]